MAFNKEVKAKVNHNGIEHEINKEEIWKTGSYTEKRRNSCMPQSSTAEAAGKRQTGRPRKECSRTVVKD